MALKLSDLVKKSIEKGYGSINTVIEKPWSQGSAPLPQNTVDTAEYSEIIPSHTYGEKKSNIAAKNIQHSDSASNNNIATNSQHSDNASNNNVATNLQHSDNASNNNVATNLQHSDNASNNNVATNLQHSDNASDNNETTNLQHSDNASNNNVATNLQHSDNASDNNVATNLQHSDNASDNNETTKSQHSNNNVTTSIQYTEIEHGRKKDTAYINIQALSGLQLNIFNKVLIMKNKINKEYFAQLNTTSLAKELHIELRSLRVSIDRLVQKNLLVREPGFMGRNGSCNFKIPNHILKYKDEIDSLKKTSFEQTYIYNNNITITKKDENTKETTSEINDWWSKLNISAIEEYGFQKVQFKQLESLNKFEIVQESINHFGWGLKHNPKNERYKENPSTVLLTVLKRGQPWIEVGYQDPEELALAQIIASKKRSTERKKKLEDEMYALLLQDWIDSLSSEENQKIVQNGRQKGDITPDKAKLSNYFKENIWPTKKSEYLIPSD